MESPREKIGPFLPSHRSDEPVHSVCGSITGTVFTGTDGGATWRLAGTD